MNPEIGKPEPREPNGLQPEQYEKKLRQLEEKVAKLETDNQELRKQAYRDRLTGAYSRLAMELMLRQMADEPVPEGEVQKRGGNPDIGVLMLDIDKFKVINDTYGHEAGDKVLAEAGRWLRGIFRGYDIVGRYGGEEFIVVFPHTDTVRLHNKLKEANENPHEVNPEKFNPKEEHAQLSFTTDVTDLKGEVQHLKVSFSGGLTKFKSGKDSSIIDYKFLPEKDRPKVRADKPTTISRADALLLKAKESGRNRILLDPEAAAELKL